MQRAYRLGDKVYLPGLGKSISIRESFLADGIACRRPVYKVLQMGGPEAEAVSSHWKSGSGAKLEYCGSPAAWMEIEDGYASALASGLPEAREKAEGIFALFEKPIQPDSLDRSA